MTILVTGFEPFDGMAANPSGEVAEALAGGGVKSAILPVSYRAMPELLGALLERPWSAVVMLGLAVNRRRVSLERVAINYRDPSRPDQEGKRPAETRLIHRGPDAYFSNLPLEELRALLEQAGVPVEISLSAGAFLCNAAFYLARHASHDQGLPCGFIHLPPAAELPLEGQIEAVGMVLDHLKREIPP